MVLPPTLVVGLGGAALLYAALVRRSRARPAATTSPTAPEIGRFAAGLLVLAVALSGPLDGAAARSLPWHMVQHQLIVLLAAPLLATSGAARIVRAAGGPSSSPPGGPHVTAVLAAAAAGLHLAVMLAWHVPTAYDAALRSETIHHLEHVTLLATAVVAWSLIVRAVSDDRAMLGALVGLALLAVGGAVLGIVLLTAPVPLYASYLTTPLDEQRVAGALMKVGALVVYVGTAITVTLRWLARLSADHPERPALSGRRAGG